MLSKQQFPDPNGSTLSYPSSKQLSMASRMKDIIMASLGPEKPKNLVPFDSKSETTPAASPMLESTSLIKLKERGTTLNKSLEISPPTSEKDKVEKIGHALYLYKELCDEIMQEYNLIMSTEFLEASAFQGVTGAVMLDESEKHCCEEMIPIIKEAKRFVTEICRPWTPPKDFWTLILDWEKTTEARYNDVMSRIKTREGAEEKLGRRVWKNSAGK